jgi:hypothetical protein
MILAHLALFFFDGAGGAVTPEPEPPAAVTPSGGRVRHKQRFAIKHRGEFYQFDTLEDVERFIKSVEPKVEKKQQKKKRAALKVQVEPEFQQELYSFDLPNIQPAIDHQRFEEVRQILERYQLAVRALEAERQDDEDLLLLA